jgi:hypothetical protein
MALDATLRNWFSEFTKATGDAVLYVQMYTEYEHEYNDKSGINEWNEDEEKPWSYIPYLSTFSFENLPDEVLDYEFSADFGRADAPPVIAWSENYVIYIDEYDGAESLRWIPRFPNVFKVKNPWDTFPES